MILIFKTIFLVHIILFIGQVIAVDEIDKLAIDEQLQHAIQDLSDLHNMESNKVKLLKKTGVTWRSGAIGCPRPNEEYTQALVQGMLYELQIDNKIYRYHAKTGGVPFYCPDKFAETSSLSSADL